MAEAICKVCLNINVKMYELRAYAIEDCYKSIIGNISEDSIMNSMLYACYECAYLIYKFKSFKEKCLRGFSLLQEVIENNAMVTCQDIAAINRDKLKLCSNLKLESSSSYNYYIENENYNVKKECNVNNSSNIDDNILSVYEVKVESDVKRDDSSDIEFGNDQIFVGPLETTKIKLTEIKFENDIANNEDLLALEYGDDQVLAIPLKRRKVQKIKNVTGTSVIKTQKQSSKNGNLKEETSQSLNERTILPLHDTVQKTTKLKKKYQVSSWNKGIKKQKSTYCNELTPEEKNMKGVLTVRILTLEEQLNNLLERKKSSNYVNSNYKCDLCYKGFMDSNTYERHMAKHDPANGSFKCPVCKTVFQKERLVRHHSKLHNRNYICNTCSHTCNNWPQAKQHQNEHVGKVYSCKHCEYITSKRSSHLSHVKLKHATGFLCNLCGFTFVSELGLSQHTTMMHGIKVTNNKVQQSSSNKQDLKTTEEVPHSKPGRYCDVCNVSCNSLQKWKRHVASSKHMYKLNGGTCGECEETFTSREDLRLHYRRVHLKEAQHDESTARQGNPFLPKTWPAKCLHCSEELSDARQYYWHFRKAHPNEEYPVQKDYICDICGKLFGFNSTLVQHRRKHVNDGLYNCMQCSKAFVDKIQLINHEKIHGDDRPFSCEVCCKTFKFETALKKHAKCHSK